MAGGAAEAEAAAQPWDGFGRIDFEGKLAPMDDRATIERYLAQAEAHVAEGEGYIIQQRQIIAYLEREGDEQAEIIARDLLTTFEQSHGAYVADRDRLRAELTALGQRQRS
ncbi:hypothetical protein NB311A_00195 [Nitrobacter sp. Nb-311A]|uniref:hypothetical protein n=1 Tax=Nitrobacter sp. Nb-311A TaxID=314253 RepID=UPI0000684D3C|nr:hypothetical protein [Nitrobacter sp. Nb-311A]EAQ33704.1 hypothetical protein NB311A_00195 [Nitrobacter sp. Nb-311A]